MDFVAEFVICNCDDPGITFQIEPFEAKTEEEAIRRVRQMQRRFKEEHKRNKQKLVLNVLINKSTKQRITITTHH